MSTELKMDVQTDVEKSVFMLKLMTLVGRDFIMSELRASLDFVATQLPTVSVPTAKNKKEK